MGLTCYNCSEPQERCDCDNPQFDDEYYLNEKNRPNRQVRASESDRVNWLGDPWPYVPGDPYY